MDRNKATRIVEDFETEGDNRESGYDTSKYFEMHRSLVDHHIEWGVGPVNVPPSIDEVLKVMDVIKAKASKKNAFMLDLREEMVEYLEMNLMNAFIERLDASDDLSDDLIEVVIGVDQNTVDSFISRILYFI
jgi:hypothetical protein